MEACKAKLVAFLEDKYALVTVVYGRGAVFPAYSNALMCHCLVFVVPPPPAVSQHLHSPSSERKTRVGYLLRVPVR